MSKSPFRSEFNYVRSDLLSLRIIDTYEADGGALPFYWWRILLTETGEEIGSISLRLGYNYHSYYNGNIGYEIDEPYQGHHYAFTACKMVLRIAILHGMETVFLTCDADNIASRRTIERLGGELLEIALPPKDYIYYYEGIMPHRIYRLDLLPRKQEGQPWQK